MAPVYKALEANPGVSVQLIHSGQHQDMADPFYESFQMRVDHRVELERKGSDLASLTAALLTSLSGVLAQINPEAVLVHGDTSTSAAAALACFYQKIPVGHVEAGLRTHDLYSPFPEELNRSLIGRIARWHFAPTLNAAKNLAKEGVDSGSVHVTGNTVIDAALMTQKRLASCSIKSTLQTWVDNIVDSGQKLVLVTSHRRENWNGGIASIAEAVGDLARRYPDIVFMWPVHANRAVLEMVDGALGAYPDVANRINLLQPIGYEEMIWTLSKAWSILTDSGGLQEEATAFKTPVLVLRESTERPELITAGGGVLVGTDKNAIISAFSRIKESPVCYNEMITAGAPFGNGSAAKLINDVLTSSLCLDDLNENISLSA